MTECMSIHTKDPLAEQLDALKELFFWHYEAGLYDLAEGIASSYRAIYRIRYGQLRLQCSGERIEPDGLDRETAVASNTPLKAVSERMGQAMVFWREKVRHVFFDISCSPGRWLSRAIDYHLARKEAAQEQGLVMRSWIHCCILRVLERLVP